VDSLSAISAFVQAAETGSFTLAGRRLGLSASAIGKSIARLEDKICVRLFHRNARSITLTHEGEVFLQSCKRIVSEMESMEQMFAIKGDKPVGKLRVSLPALSSLFVPVLNRFAKTHPEIELDLDFNDQLVDVIADGFDVAVRTGYGSDSRLISRRLGSYHLTIVGSREYFTRAGKPASVGDLRFHSCIHHRFPSTGKLERWPFDDAASAAEELFIPVTAAANTIEPMVRFVESGFGIACLPDFAVRKLIEEGRLESVLDEHVVHSNVFRAVWPSSRHLAPKIRAFVDFMALHLFDSSAGEKKNN
jgi:DNA-binding transcriptional LysR family regulator